MRKGSQLIVVLGLLSAGSAMAANPTITEFSPLTFGEMAISGPTADALVIDADGAESHGPTIIPLLQGHNAIIRLTDFPPNWALAIIADDSVLSHQPSGAAFDVTTYTFDPDASHQTTDNNGDMTLKLGATLSKRAGTTYTDGPYRGTYNLLVNY